MEPSRSLFEQVELGTGVQRIFEAFGIIRAVTLAGNDLAGRDNAADCIGPRPAFHDDRCKEIRGQKAANRCRGDQG